MTSSLELRGVFVPLVTPFTAAGDVAIDEVEHLAAAALDAGAAGIVALGTTGEPATLDQSEQVLVVERIAAVCRRQSAALIVGAGSNSTREALGAVERINAIDGVTALLSVVPYYTRPSEEGVVEHFRRLAEASRVPLVLYNIPYRTGRALGSRALLELALVPNIAGLKQAVGGLDGDTLRLMAERPPGFHVLSGDDPFLFSLLCLGGSGAIAASAHVCAVGFVALVEAVRRGDLGEARELATILLPVCEALFSEPSPAVVKGVLHRRGQIETPELRLPMTRASEAAVERAVQAVARADELIAKSVVAP